MKNRQNIIRKANNFVTCCLQFNEALHLKEEQHQSIAIENN